MATSKKPSSKKAKSKPTNGSGKADQGKANAKADKLLKQLSEDMKQLETRESPPIMVVAQYLRDSSFEAPGLPALIVDASAREHLASGQGSLNIELGHRQLRENLVDFRLHVRSSLAQKDDPEKIIWIAEVDYHAVVTVDTSVSHSILSYLLYVEVARILFPFARHSLINLVIDGSLPPPGIQGFDFASLFSQRVRDSGFPYEG